MAGVEDEADLAGFFDVEDFAVDGTWRRADGTSVVLSGIFDREFLAADVGASVEVETDQPRFQVASAKVAGMKNGDRLELEGVAYRVRGLEPDGTGTTHVVLSRD